MWKEGGESTPNAKAKTATKMLLKKADDAAAGEDFSDDPLVLVVASPFFCGMVDGRSVGGAALWQELAVVAPFLCLLVCSEWRVQDLQEILLEQTNPTNEER